MSREIRVRGIRRLFSLPSSRRRVQREVDDEIRFHIESRVAELVAGGLAPGAARDGAARRVRRPAGTRRSRACIPRAGLFRLPPRGPPDDVVA